MTSTKTYLLNQNSLTTNKLSISQNTWEDEYDYREVLKVRKYLDNKNVDQPCLHDQCPECNGTGMRKLGGFCFHSLSCSCSKCGVR